MEDTSIVIAGCGRVFAMRALYLSSRYRTVRMIWDDDGELRILYAAAPLKQPRVQHTRQTPLAHPPAL